MNTAMRLMLDWFAGLNYTRLENTKSSFAPRGTPSKKGANVFFGQTRGDRKKEARARVLAAYVQAQLDIKAEKERQAKNAKRRLTGRVGRPTSMAPVED